MANSSNGVAIVSGGLDSVTMLHWLVEHNYRPHVLSFNYQQRHLKEVAYAAGAAERFGLPWSMIDLVDFGEALQTSGSALVNRSISVPEGHYEEELMRSTVVPNRNMIMASIAAGISIAEGGLYVAAGPHNGDAAIYPDCRPVFWKLLEEVIRRGNDGFIDQAWKFELPFINKTKTDIALEAKRLGVPVQLTWSCYNGGINHCGRCGTCVERLEAMHAAKVNDPTVYDDPDFWKAQVNA